ncbi:hypothetical protein SSPIM334S_00579 [Streptomyces spiroverticillatus]
MSVSVSPSSPSSPLSHPAGAAALPTVAVPVDAERWPDVARLPKASAARTAVARGIVRHALAGLPLTVKFRGGRPLGTGGPSTSTATSRTASAGSGRRSAPSGCGRRG